MEILVKNDIEDGRKPERPIRCRGAFMCLIDVEGVEGVENEPMTMAKIAGDTIGVDFVHLGRCVRKFIAHSGSPIEAAGLFVYGYKNSDALGKEFKVKTEVD